MITVRAVNGGGREAPRGGGGGRGGDAAHRRRRLAALAAAAGRRGAGGRAVAALRVGGARLGGRRSLVAALFTAATVVLILIPLALLATIAVREATDAIGLVRSTIASEGVEGLIAKAPDPIEGWLHRLEKQLPTEIDRAQSQFAAGGRWALGAVSGALAVLARFGFRLAMMLIAFFFLLRDGRALVDWLADATPLPPERVRAADARVPHRRALRAGRELHHRRARRRSSPPSASSSRARPARSSSAC